jgi:DDE superfamily endonuclease
MTLAEIHSSQSQFQEISSNSVISDFIGALDGLLVVVKSPSMKDSSNNPSSYYSGQYSCDGLNVQAICNASCHFTFFAVAAPGKLSDQAAIECTALTIALDNLPISANIVGDAAYVWYSKVAHI